MKNAAFHLSHSHGTTAVARYVHFSVASFALIFRVRMSGLRFGFFLHRDGFGADTAMFIELALADAQKP